MDYISIFDGTFITQARAIKEVNFVTAIRACLLFGISEEELDPLSLAIYNKKTSYSMRDIFVLSPGTCFGLLIDCDITTGQYKYKRVCNGQTATFIQTDLYTGLTVALPTRILNDNLYYIL